MAEKRSFWHDGQRGTVLTTMARSYAASHPRKRPALTKQFLKVWCTQFAEDVDSMGSHDALKLALVAQIHKLENLTPPRRRRTEDDIIFVGSRQGTADEVRQARRRRQEQRSSPYGLSRYGVAIINIVDDPPPDTEDVVLIKSGRRTVHQASLALPVPQHQTTEPNSTIAQSSDPNHDNGDGSRAHPYIL